MKTIELFNQEVLVKDSLCGPTKESRWEVDPSLRLYVKVTDSCNANCKFCANGSCTDFGKIDLQQLDFVIRYLKENNRLHSIALTGGEPMTNPDRLNDILNLIWNIDKKIQVQISTNGLNLREIAGFDDPNNLESIHISRHHYDDSKNIEIFGTNTIATAEDIMFLQESLTNKKLININTLVMKGYIEDLEGIKKMLDYVGETGVYKNGFVSLMKCNDYATDKFINFNHIFNNLDKNFLLAHRFYASTYCECIDGVYSSKNAKFVEFYARMVKECKCPYTTQLVYTSDNKVTAGFGGKVLFKSIKNN